MSIPCSKIKDFGTLNGYSTMPEEVQKCWDKRHTLEGRVLGKCFVEHYCPECKIRYSIDSSD